MHCIKEVLDEIQNFGRDHSLQINFRKIKDQEKALYRLSRIGILRNYNVEYGSKIFIVDFKSFDIEDCKKQLLNYIASSSPGRTQSTKKIVNNINHRSHKENIIAISRVFIEFIYDNVERARRQAIRDMVSLARNANTDRAIRTTILDYLQEGVGFDQIIELVNATRVDLSAFLDRLKGCNTILDANQLKSQVGRILESNPDHPGLFLLRSASEMLAKKPDEVAALQDLQAAIANSLTKYSVNESEWEEIIDSLIELSQIRNRQMLSVLAYTLHKTNSEGIIKNNLLDYFYSKHTGKNKRIDQIKEVFDLSKDVNKLSKAIPLVVRTMGDKKFKARIGV